MHAPVIAYYSEWRNRPGGHPTRLLLTYNQPPKVFLLRPFRTVHCWAPSSRKQILQHKLPCKMHFTERSLKLSVTSLGRNQRFLQKDYDPTCVKFLGKSAMQQIDGAGYNDLVVWAR